MRKDFDKQWARRQAWRERCPLDDDELRRRVLLAQQTGVMAPVVEHPARRRRLWGGAVAAAACLLAVLLPVGLRAQSSEGPERVNVDGREIYFVCNCGCSADETVGILNTMIR